MPDKWAAQGSGESEKGQLGVLGIDRVFVRMAYLI